MAGLKLKITSRKPKVYVGEEAIEQVPKGRLLQCISVPKNIEDETAGDIVIRTDETEYPFVTLYSESPSHVGWLWGDAIDGYQFIEIEGTITM